MSITHPDAASVDGERLALGSYLQAVAAALAAPDATAERVLRAAHARDARQVDFFIKFSDSDSRATEVAVQLASGERDKPDPARPPETVEFRFDRAETAPTLAEVGRAFGPWTDVVSGRSAGDPFQVDFTTPYPPELRGARPRGPLIVVSASLRGNARTADVRLRRVLLRRFAADQ